jgi:hydroxymethylpyrimidine/phosphomethylpyrimidine kinase
MPKSPPNVLTIAGTDPSGGAGIQADIKTFSALGAYAASAITAIVAQNTQGVRSFVTLESAFVADQIDAVLEDVRIDAVKIGMVANAGIAGAIAESLRRHAAKNIVLDPVMVAKSGHHLLDPDAVAAVREYLVPLATVVTPNLPEAAVLLDAEPSWSLEEMHLRAGELHRLGAQWVLLKGGHLEDSSESVDLLYDGRRKIELAAPRIDTRNDHGTGCTLSAAIAALLPSRGVEDSVRAAKAYMHGALAASGELEVGQGRGPLHHFHLLWPRDDVSASAPSLRSIGAYALPGRDRA